MKKFWISAVGSVVITGFSYFVSYSGLRSLGLLSSFGMTRPPEGYLLCQAVNTLHGFPFAWYITPCAYKAFSIINFALDLIVWFLIVLLILSLFKKRQAQ